MVERYMVTWRSIAPDEDRADVICHTVGPDSHAYASEALVAGFMFPHYKHALTHTHRHFHTSRSGID